MDQKEMMAVIYNYAHFDEARDNAEYQFTDAEQARFHRAVQACRDKVQALLENHYDDEIAVKIYGD